MSTLPWVHPRFEKPPVVETAFSIHFTQLERWQIPYFGLYWQSIRDRYPKLNAQPALPSQLESFDGNPEPAPSLSLSFPGPLQTSRCWFFNEDETRLIQLQHDRFVFNWKRGLTNESYQSFDDILPTIRLEWDSFCSFVRTETLGMIQVKQCEITYVNHIEKGVGWTSYKELSEILPVWTGRTQGGFLPPPEDVEITARYLIPERLGRLRISVQPAIRIGDRKEIIQLSLVSRGRPQSSDPEKVFAWFERVQEFTSKSFLDFTSEKLHLLWGKKGSK